MGSTGAEVTRGRDDPADKDPPQLQDPAWLWGSVLAQSCPAPQSTGAGIINTSGSDRLFSKH